MARKVNKVPERIPRCEPSNKEYMTLNTFIFAYTTIGLIVVILLRVYGKNLRWTTKMSLNEYIGGIALWPFLLLGLLVILLSKIKI